MVVGKVMRWSPRAPSAAADTKTYRVRIKLNRVEGLSPAASKSVAVSVNWTGPPRAGGLSYLRVSRAKRTAHSISREAIVDTDGFADWSSGEEEESREFERTCCFCKTSPDSFMPWHVSFNLLHGFRDNDRKQRKPVEIGATSVNLTDWVWPSQPQSKQIPISLTGDRSAILYVSVGLVEADTDRTQARLDDNSCSSNADASDLSSSTQSTDGSAPSSRSSSGSSSPELQAKSPSKRRLLSWRKRPKMADRANDEPIGSWEAKEYISRDKRTKLKTRTFFASIDQRDETAGGESACTALVAVIADALHSNGANYLPTRAGFDALIREGSSEWRKLCRSAPLIDRFPDKHFDLDTVLEAKIRPVSVLPEKSFIGFFEPERFESLQGAMSFDEIWDEISSAADNNSVIGGSRIYIVSWNDHFFLLKVEGDAYYIIDTLGERLFEGCSRAYMLRFDGSSGMYRLGGKRGDGDELICRGKECCREFIKEFFAAIPLREELEIEKKGNRSSNAGLLQRLQIEFHHTQNCSS